MRLAGHIPNESAALRFADYLRTLNIASKVEPSEGHWAIWIRDESHLTQGKRELEEFLRDPSTERYSGVSRSAHALRREEAARDGQARKNLVDMRDRWHQPVSRMMPLTMLLFAASVGVGFWTNFGKELDAVRPYLFIERLPTTASIRAGLGKQGDIEGLDEWIDRLLRGKPRQPLADVRRGELWRLVTPIFIHMSLIHLAGNMYWLFILGSLIEVRRGTWRLALLVLTAAMASNLAQCLYSGPNFGGMSGVVYALFGFVWMRSRFDPGSGIYIDPGNVLFMIAWFILCMTGSIGPIANVAHAVGFAVGLAAGYLPLLVRRR